MTRVCIKYCILTLILSSCVSSYDRWYTKNPGIGTYRIIEEYYNPKINNGFGRLKANIYDAVDRKELNSIVEISSNDTIFKLDTYGEMQTDLKEGLYRLKINSFAHHEMKTKYIQIRENYEIKIELYIGAEY